MHQSGSQSGVTFGLPKRAEESCVRSLTPSRGCDCCRTAGAAGSGRGPVLGRLSGRPAVGRTAKKIGQRLADREHQTGQCSSPPELASREASRAVVDCAAGRTASGKMAGFLRGVDVPRRAARCALSEPFLFPYRVGRCFCFVCASVVPTSANPKRQVQDASPSARRYTKSMPPGTAVFD